MSSSTPQLIHETLLAARILALSVPFVFMSALLCGILSAFHKFDQINIVRASIGILTYLIPALLSVWFPNLAIIAAVFLVLRVIAFILHLLQCRRLMPELVSRLPVWNTDILKELIRYGGWLTISNIVGPFMATLDRFYIGNITNATEVTNYVTPYEVASRLSMIPGAILPVFFPIMVSNRLGTNKEKPNLLNILSSWMALACSFPAILLSLISPMVLRGLMGDVVSNDSVIVLQVLSSGIYINCVALVYFYQIQARGRTDLIAKIHTAELIPYLVCLWYFTTTFGIIGTSVAWTLRVAFDGLIFCWISNRDVRYQEKRVSFWIYVLVLFASVFIAGVSFLPTGFLLLLVPFLVLALCWPFLSVWRDVMFHVAA